jgi:hypothetical protein
MASRTTTQTQTLDLVLRMTQQSLQSISRVHDLADAELAELERLIQQRIRNQLPSLLQALQTETITDLDRAVQLACYDMALAVLKERRAKCQLSESETMQLQMVPFLLLRFDLVNRLMTLHRK